MEDMETVRIGPGEYQTTHIRTTLPKDEEIEILWMLRDNADIFTWEPTYMSRIDPGVVCY